MPITLDGTLGITTPALTVDGATVNTGGISTAGNLVFSSTGQRILGDFSTGTFTDRLAFQTSTTNSGTRVGALPNGTSLNSSFDAFNNSDPTNAAYGRFGVTGATDVTIQSGITGTGAYLPLTMYTGGSERMRIDTSGNVVIGATVGAGKFTVTNGLSFLQNTAAGTQEVLKLDNSDTTAGTNAVKLSFSSSGVTKASITSAVYGNGFMDFAVNADTFAMRIDASGNVGIGTTAQTTRLGFGAYIPADGQTINVYQNGNTRSGIGVVSGVFRHYTDSGSVQSFGQVSTADGSTYTERARIDSTGNVGIGNTNPTAKLEISTTSFSGQLRLSGSNQNGMWFSKADGTGGFAVGRSVGADNSQNYFIYDANVAVTRFLINESGYVTTPSQPSFRANTTSGTYPATGGNIINFNNVSSNISGSFATSGGNAYKRFTAPVAGEYLFTASLMGNTGTGRYYFQIRKNGSGALQSGGSATDYGNFTIAAVISMAVNDYVDVYLFSGTLYGASTAENYFSGRLLG